MRVFRELSIMGRSLLASIAVVSAVGGLALMACVISLSASNQARAAAPRAASHGSAAQAPAGPPAAFTPLPAGALESGTAAFEDLTLHDSGRSKGLPVRVYYPTQVGDAKLPVIVFSHGLGGSREGAVPLASDWAAHGYAVICPTHEDSVKLRRSEGKSLDPTQMLIEMGMNDAGRVSRVQDDVLILDSLKVIEHEIPALAGKLDAEHCGIAGHSAGAMTAALLAGAKNDLPSGGRLQSFRDTRFDYAMLLSGQGVGQAGFTKSSWEGISEPMMVMTGSQDYARTKQTPEARCDPYTYASPGSKYLVFLNGAVHSSFTGKAAEMQQAVAEKGELTWQQRAEQAFTVESLDSVLAADQGAIFTAIQETSLAFWEANLKGNRDAQRWLDSDAPAEHYSGLLEYSHK